MSARSNGTRSVSRAVAGGRHPRRRTPLFGRLDDGNDRSAVGMALVRGTLRRGGEAPCSVDAERRTGERRDLPALRCGRQRQDPCRADGHQGAARGRCGRSRAVDSRDEGRVPDFRGRCGESVRGAAAHNTIPCACGLCARRVHRGLRRAGRRDSRSRGPQAEDPLHRWRLHGRTVRGPRGWQAHPHHRDRIRRRGRGHPGGQGSRACRVHQYQLSQGPGPRRRRQAGTIRGGRRRHQFGQVPRGRA